jgi:hypothetical protein
LSFRAKTHLLAKAGCDHTTLRVQKCLSAPASSSGDLVLPLTIEPGDDQVAGVAEQEEAIAVLGQERRAAPA